MSRLMRIFGNKSLRYLLWPLSLPYRGIISLRNLFYAAGVFKVYRVPARVVSIGNLSVGGTGKTPATIFLARSLQERGFRVAVLSRGYRRESAGPVLVSDGEACLQPAHTVGDEPVLIAEALSGVPVLVDANRVRGARRLIELFRPDAILLDDGFQHRRLHRDVDVLLVDAERFSANSSLLPAGPYREPPSAAKRADLIYVLNSSAESGSTMKPAETPFRSPGRARCFPARKVPDALRTPNDSVKRPVSWLQGKRIFALAGIAQPENFRRELQQLGANIACFETRPDHHRYSADDVRRLIFRYRNAQAELLVTTAKDWVKLQSFGIEQHVAVNILEIAFRAPTASVNDLISRIRQKPN